MCRAPSSRPRCDVGAERPVLSLDAIHLAAADVVGADLRAVGTYDLRVADAARALSLAVESPG